jgi:LysR family transcriptional regulator (chromosome initiation inhibitor)
MIDYKLLEAFSKVVQEGGFEKAANILHLTQSAVSQRVKLLEDRAGKILLSRTTPPQPTDTGRRLIKHYLQVKLLEDSLEEDVSLKKSSALQLSIGINADSLSSWFLPAIGGLLNEGNLLIDLYVDDQEQTLKLLKDGLVVGCISDMAAPIQGCKVEFIGSMQYRLLATPSFITKWFPEGLNALTAEIAPAVMFSRKDMLHYKILQSVLGQSIDVQSIHYVPSIEQFTQMISSGYAYGMVPDWQSKDLLTKGDLIEINEKALDSVKLYWHCWNIDSAPLKLLTNELVKNARVLISM